MSNQKNKSKEKTKDNTKPEDTKVNESETSGNNETSDVPENTGALNINAIVKNIKKQAYLNAHSLQELAKKLNEQKLSVKKVMLKFGIFHAVCEELDLYNKEHTFAKSVNYPSVHESVDFINRRSGEIEEVLVLDGNRVQFIARFLTEAYEKAEKEVEAEKAKELKEKEEAEKKAKLAEIEAQEKELAEKKKQLK